MLTCVGVTVGRLLGAAVRSSPVGTARGGNEDSPCA